MTDIKEGFLRQRRNLMAITIVIFLSYFWDVEFKTINILGNTIDLNQGNNVYFVLWTLLFYWSWRYRNYLLELRPLGIMDSLEKARYRLCYEWLERNSTKQCFWDNTSHSVRGQGPVDASGIKSVNIDPSSSGLTNRLLIIQLGIINDPQPWRGDNITVDINLSLWRFLSIHYKAIMHVINDTRLFSEYIFPPLMTLAFIGYWLICHLLTTC